MHKPFGEWPSTNTANEPEVFNTITRSKVNISDFWDGFSSSLLPLHHNLLQQCTTGIEDNICQIMVILSEIFAADADDNLDDTNNNEHQLAEDRDDVLRGLQRDHYQQQRRSSWTPPWKVSTWYHLKPILLNTWILPEKSLKPILIISLNYVL